ncbi:MAG: hypothetical protein E6Q77_01615 [Rhizobium sp.]|nr:MAG: hypothetical protein E6Q77_01615 [Rhizobium sp.]
MPHRNSENRRRRLTGETPYLRIVVTDHADETPEPEVKETECQIAERRGLLTVWLAEIMRGFARAAAAFCGVPHDGHRPHDGVGQERPADRHGSRNPGE